MREIDFLAGLPRTCFRSSLARFPGNGCVLEAARSHVVCCSVNMKLIPASSLGCTMRSYHSTSDKAADKCHGHTTPATPWS